MVTTFPPVQGGIYENEKVNFRDFDGYIIGTPKWKSHAVLQNFTFSTLEKRQQKGHHEVFV